MSKLDELKTEVARLEAQAQTRTEQKTRTDAEREYEDFRLLTIRDFNHERFPQYILDTIYERRYDERERAELAQKSVNRYRLIANLLLAFNRCD